MPPAYVKPFVKRNKSDTIDAAACCTAMRQPDMRFVPVKTVEQQAALSLHRSRDLLVSQRTQLGNALRALLSEFGIVAGKGKAGLARLMDELRAGTPDLPVDAVASAIAPAGLRQVKARPERASPWLRGMMARRPSKVVAVAQAARTARILWAMLSHNQPYRAPAIG